MRTLAIALAITVVAISAEAQFKRSELVDAVGYAEIVLDAEILSSRAAQWTPPNSPATACGFVYEGRTIEAFKGQSRSIVTFAGPVSLQVGGRYLLFLKSYEGDFESDSHIRLGGDYAARKERCLNDLPLLKASWLHLGTFLSGEFLQLSDGLVPSEASKPADIVVERVRSRGEVVNLGEGRELRAIPPEVETLLSFYSLDPFGTTVVSWPGLRAQIIEAVGAMRASGASAAD